MKDGRVEISEFYAARLDEDEATAKAAASTAGARWHHGRPSGRSTVMLLSEQGSPLADMLSRDDEEIAPFVARHDPARVLREVEAKRAILAEHEAIYPAVGRPDGGGVPDPEGTLHVFAYCHVCDEDAPCPTVRHLVAVHSYHPDYQESWKP